MANIFVTLLINIFNFASFLSGIIFGILLSIAVLIYLLSNPNHDSTKDTATSSALGETNTTSTVAVASATTLTKTANSTFQRINLSTLESDKLNQIIDTLNELNSPLKALNTLLTKIHTTRDIDNLQIENKMKTILDYNIIMKIEKEFQENITKLRDHNKQIKSITNFFNEITKNILGYSKDLSKLSNVPKTYMNKTTMLLEDKEDFIVNHWWQSLQVTFDHMSNDYESLSSHISDEIITYFLQLQEEMTMIEKRLINESNKQFAIIREHVALFDSKLREREKNKEKLFTISGNIPPNSPQIINSTDSTIQKYYNKLKLSEENLVIQTRKLYEIQKEFYILLPKINSDIQLTILKSIIQSQSYFFKIISIFERMQSDEKHVFNRMKLQLMNASQSLLQMIKEENMVLFPRFSSIVSSSSAAAAAAAAASSSSIASSSASLAPSSIPGETTSSAANNPSNSVNELYGSSRVHTLQGYESTLQILLEELLLQSQIKIHDSTTSPHPEQEENQSSNPVTNNGLGANYAKLNMAQETTACLAASNPAILSDLPPVFKSAIGVETCVWFNAFSGRVYRDISNSKYFYNWFCNKLTHMMNKREKERPGYIDRFVVTNVEFGDLPPLLMNVQWSPPVSKSNASRAQAKPVNTPDQSASINSQNAEYELEDDDDEDDDSSSSSEDESEPKASESIGGTSKKFTSSTQSSKYSSSATNPTPNAPANTSSPPSKSKSNKKIKVPKEAKRDDLHNESYYYAACTADMAFRSGIKFVISTKLWLNWPRDRYASVPVIFHLELVEMSGKIRFGVRRGYSFLSFLKDPLTRINVRSEVGGDKYKLKDIPQVSDYIERKLKGFIHDKFVHPHSHKFRLIWPRNWWPEGTEDMFLPSDGNANKEGSNSPKKSHAAPVPAAAPAVPSSSTTTTAPSVSSTSSVSQPATVPDTPAVIPRNTSTKEQSTPVRSRSDTTTTPASVPSIKQQPSSPEQSESIPPPRQPTSAVPPVASNPPPVLSTTERRRTSSSAPLPQTRPKSYSIETSLRSTYEPESMKEKTNAVYSIENQWTRHLNSMILKAKLSPTPSPSISLSDSAQQSLLNSFFRKTRKQSTESSLLLTRTRSFSTIAISRARISRSRSMSISDFRTVTLDCVFNNELLLKNENMLDELLMIQEEEYEDDYDDQQPSQSFDEKTTAKRIKSREDRLAKRATRRDSTFSQLTSEDDTKSWLKAKGREQLAKAKARFTEFKLKHFGNSTTSNTPTVSHAPSRDTYGEQTVSTTTNSSSSVTPTPYSAANNNNTNVSLSSNSRKSITSQPQHRGSKIGDKLKDFFLGEGDESSFSTTTSTTTSVHNNNLSNTTNNTNNTNNNNTSLYGIFEGESSNNNITSNVRRPRTNSMASNDETTSSSTNNNNNNGNNKNMMKYVTSIFRSVDKEKESSHKESSHKDIHHSTNTTATMFSKALHSVRSQLDKDKEI